MELNIIKQIKATLRDIRKAKRKAVQIVEKSKPVELARKEAIAKNKTIVSINGEELTLSQIAKRYNLELATVRARYRVGNRGKLLIRPSHRQQKPT